MARYYLMAATVAVLAGLVPVTTGGYQKKWRKDGRCGPKYPIEGSKDPSECNPDFRPCCSNYGYCGTTKHHCNCKGCVDYHTVTTYEQGNAVNRQMNTDKKPLSSPHYVAKALKGMCEQLQKKAGELKNEKAGLRTAMPAIPGYIFGNPGFQYKLYRTKMNHKDAQKACEKDGASLAMAKTKKSLDYIRTKFNKERFHIGIIQDLKAPGKPWKFDDGTIVPKDLLPWDKKQSKNRGEHCSGFWASKKLHDVPCELKALFLCKAPLFDFSGFKRL